MISKDQEIGKAVSWNPLTGCTKASAGCLNCYAERMAKRLQAMGNPKYRNGFALTLHEDALELPFKWKATRDVFVNSMGDLFHEGVPLEFILKVFAVMNEARKHIFTIITKRSNRLAELAQELPWSDNIQMGVTVESAAQRFRIEHLRDVPAARRFLCCEPLIGSLGQLDLSGVDFVLAGPESGPRARPMNPLWLEEIARQCKETGVRFSSRYLNPEHWREEIGAPAMKKVQKVSEKKSLEPGGSQQVWGMLPGLE